MLLKRQTTAWADVRNPPVLPPVARRGAAIVLAILALVLAAPAGRAQNATTHPALNKYCPVMPEEEADPNITTVYKGRTIAFCCDNCLAKFKANPDRYFARLLALDAQTAEAGGSPAGDDAHASEKHAGAAHAHDAETPPATGDHPDADHAAGKEEEADHQHGTGEDRPPLLARLHPVIVHFPVAGVPLALLGLLAWLVSRKPVLALADVVPLGVATLAAVAAVITGNMAHDSMRFSSSLENYVHWHQYVATTVMILLLLLSGVRLWRWNRLAGGWLRLYAGGLVVVCLLVGLAGYLGGALVFGPDHLAW